MYRAHLVAGASLQTAPSEAFNFGTGDFTVMTMISSVKGGTAVARKGAAGGSGNGGFLLVVNPDGSVKFATDNGFGYYQVVSAPSSILDGDCHTIAGIRTGAQLSIFIDGVAVSVTASGNAAPPLNVNNNLPLTIGCTQQYQEPHNQFLGNLMNVSVWNTALRGDLLVSAAFARITGSEANLQGYWTLDDTTADLSPHRNPARSVGAVTYEYCLHCMWVAGDNAYTFCSIANMPDQNTPDMTVTLARDVSVPTGSRSFGMSILANQDVPAFPVGAQVVLTDPLGNAYNQDANTDGLFVLTRNGQPWAVMVTNPIAGKWTVRVTAPSKTAFHLFTQTVPTSRVVQTCEQTLAPLFQGVSGHGYAVTDGMTARAQLSWSLWDTIAAVAVGVITGAVVAGVIVASGGAAIPAVLAGLVAFTGVEASLANQALTVFDTGNLPVATAQTAGMAGFVVAAGKLLLMDANVEADRATQLIYKQRKKKLYPVVTASTFNKVQQQLVGEQMKRAKVADAMSGFAQGYVSGAGHGKPTYLMGWYVSGNDGPLEEVLATFGAAKFSAQEVSGRIIHFFACNTGAAGTDSSPGLGRAMVTAGAVAFFGYNLPFIINVEESPAFCSCDIAIDLAMIAGKTCELAYNESIALYDSTIKRLKADGNTQAAAQLESNRNALVSPVTSSMYGNKDAYLTISG
ncbi:MULTISPECIES: LamG domain-containing protein [Burkholderia]|uniref:Uncharacterized protein n=1 Tax=Burkholderia paludis TaxID=1506587 RepID=A0A6P2SDZ1_9BURK|nr:MULTISPECIES: LamG domain-containing protein [Burkholderia]CAB3759826.1 hypothetical protein LMG30113_03537 [Burkholderia paludis]VWC43914.1 hypothetical protein BPA30113_07138 [Burkholderia paludis]